MMENRNDKSATEATFCLCLKEDEIRELHDLLYEIGNGNNVSGNVVCKINKWQEKLKKLTTLKELF